MAALAVAQVVANLVVQIVVQQHVQQIAIVVVNHNVLVVQQLQYKYINKRRKLLR